MVGLLLIERLAQCAHYAHYAHYYYHVAVVASCCVAGEVIRITHAFVCARN